MGLVESPRRGRETDMTRSSRTEQRERTPFTIPRPARRIGTMANFLPAKHQGHTCISIGVSTSTSSEEIAECLISHQGCDLLNKGTELICSCGLLS